MIKIIQDLLKSINTNYEYMLFVLIVLLIAFIINRILSTLIIKSLEISEDTLHIDPTKFQFLRHSLGLIVYFGAFITIIWYIPSLRSVAVSLLAGASVFAAIIGFASQQAFSNIISGVFIVMFKPFRVNDRVKIGNESYGVVEDITMRHTVIRNFENHRIVIPNSIISNQTVTNYTIIDARTQKQLHFFIHPEIDIRKALHIIEEIIEKHPLRIDNRNEEALANHDPEFEIYVTGWKEEGLKVEAFVWVETPSHGFQLACDVYLGVKERFDQEGFKYAYPGRNIQN